MVWYYSRVRYNLHKDKTLQIVPQCGTIRVNTVYIHYISNRLYMPRHHCKSSYAPVHRPHTNMRDYAMTRWVESMYQQKRRARVNAAQDKDSG